MKHQAPDLQLLLDGLPPSEFRRSLEFYSPHIRAGEGALIHPKELRALLPQEISQLECQGNCCPDWSKVKVCPSFHTKHIFHSQFLGNVLLQDFDGTLKELPGGGSLPSGIYFSTLQDCEIGSNSTIHRCAQIANTVVDSNAACVSSTISHQGRPCAFGNGSKLKIGIETGGREIRIFYDLSLDLAEFLLRSPHKKDQQKSMGAWLDAYLTDISRPYTIICKEAFISGSKMENSYAGPRVQIMDTLLISNSTLASTVSDPIVIGPGSIIRSSVIQEGVKVEDGAIVDTSMLFEHSDVTQHGKSVESLIGPNSGVSKGETTSSFLGPFVGFHHQSLLIAAFWPRGRGNIAYGANVGSNHTSRVPDQEFWPGEGMFFGLGCSVKYPSNFSHAPYTIIAAGVSTLPQKMSFPFSLINEPVGYFLEVPPGYNNLIPAWGLSENLYSLYRNEGKYKARNKAKRNTFDLDLFRPEIIVYMHDAIAMLKSIKERKTIYLPGDIPGIGKNMLTDENRLKAISAYEFFLDLTELRHRASHFDTENPAISSTHERKKALQDLERLHGMLPTIIQKVEISRARDFERGCAIIDDYQHTHVPVDQDTFVLQTRQQIRSELAALENLITKISSLTL